MGLPLSMAAAIFLYRLPQINLDKVIEIWFLTDTSVEVTAYVLRSLAFGRIPR